MKSIPSLLAALAVLALAGCDRNLVTLENAARLKPGMPEAEIPKVLGDRNFGKSWGGKLASYTYRSEKLWVSVKCREGKIVRVLTRDPARKVELPARKEMPLLDLTIAYGSVGRAMDAAIQQGGALALTEWMNRELVPGRPVRVSDGRETVLVDRGAWELDADGASDFAKPVVAPLTDEHEWHSVATSALSGTRSDVQPPLGYLLLVAQPERK